MKDMRIGSVVSQANKCEMAGCIFGVAMEQTGEDVLH